MKITSFDGYSCEWCKEIKQKYLLRLKIANKLDVENDFLIMQEYATCPFHKATVWAIATIPRIRFKDKKVIVEWGSRNYSYCMTFNLEDKTIQWGTNHEPSSDVPIDRFDFDALFRELLMIMNKEQLEKLEGMLEGIPTDDDKIWDYIAEKFDDESYEIIDYSNEDKTIAVDDKKYKVNKLLLLKCNDAKITKKVQGYKLHRGKAYYKDGREVYLLSF